MACETGNCPECVIRVGATNVTPVNYHLFIWYTDGDRDIVYRGGPESGSTYASAVEAGLASSYEAAPSEGYDVAWPWYNLVTNRQEGLARNHDYVTWAAKGASGRMVTVAQGSAYCGLDERFTLETRRIGELGRTYNAISLDRIDNSNATVFTILQKMDITPVKPAISAPGWGTNLHAASSLPEMIERVPDSVRRGVDQVTRPVHEQIRWFDGLSAMDQANFMRRLFGG